MARHKLVIIPDPRLRIKTKTITVFDAALQQLVDDMFETMYAERGVGLAATQIGLDIAIAVIDVTEDKTQPLVLINPEILEAKDFEVMQEGCLSVPKVYDKVSRATYVRFRALDRFGKPYEMEATGLLAEAVQHETDHLHGKLYIDMLSAFKRERALAKMEKLVREKK